MEIRMPETVGSPQDGGAKRQGLGTDPRYRVIRPHARGGLGEILIAEDAQFRREIALKRVRVDGPISPIRMERFWREAEITGRLEHPGVVPVYERGTGADGRPFYAMRLILGETLREPVERFHRAAEPDYAGLAFRHLLGRFVNICYTIGYAHSRGVLHRDIKPTNVMLGEFGETLVVDWGLAKDIGQSRGGMESTASGEAPGTPHRSPDRSLTVEGQAVGTPAYMSPEQAAGRAVGPASDVYSLGATLHFMLTGRPPAEAAEDVSGRVNRGDLPAARRLESRVPAPLDAICRKAMASEPGDRYRSAIQLAGDIECWLADEPVSARRESRVERGRRWARRRRTLVSGLAAALAVAFLALGTAVPLLSYAWRQEAAAHREERRQGILAGRMAEQAEEQRALAVEGLEAARRERSAALASERRAAAERDRAEKALRFLVEAFRRSDPSADGRALKVVDVLGRAAKEVEATFADSPAAGASLLCAIGETFSGLGLPGEALEAFDRVVAWRRRALGEDHPETLAATRHLAIALQDSGRLDRAIPLYESVLARRRAILGEGHPETVESLNDAAVARFKSGRFSEAIPLYQEVLRRVRARRGEDDPEALAVADNLAVAYSAAGRPAEAIPLQEHARAGLRTKLGDDHPETLVATHNLARSYARAGRTGEAIRLYEAALGKMRSRLGGDHPETLTLLSGLAGAYRDAGRRGEAIGIYEQVLAARRGKLGPGHPQTLRAGLALARTYFEADRPDRAVPLAEEYLGEAGRWEEGRLRGPIRKEVRETARLLVDHLDRAGGGDRAAAYRKLSELRDPRE